LDQVPIARVPEQFVNESRNTTSVHRDNYLGSPADLLDKADPWLIRTEVKTVSPEGHVLTPVSEKIHQAVVVAAGYRTDLVLTASGLPPVTGVRPLFGSAILFDSPALPDMECLTVMTRPYVHYTFRRWGDRWRGGDTVERHPDAQKITAVMDLAGRYYREVTKVEVYGGTRPVCDRMFVGPVSGRVFAATGGHRVGFGLAGAVAERVAGQVEKMLS